MSNQGGYIAGRWIGAESEDRFVVRNPATGVRLASVARMGADEAIRAIGAAELGLAIGSTVVQREHWLSQVAGELFKRRDELAMTITAEQGKPIRESLAEVDYSAGFFRFFSTQLSQLGGRELPMESRGCRWSVHHRPVGVVGMITPWNFPLAMLSKKLAAALAAGCAVVAKPSELTPLSAIKLFEVLHNAEIPEGVVNLVMGKPQEIGEAMCVDPRVRLLSFTGSTVVGKQLSIQAAPHLKRLSLELGGNAPFIVFRDADLELAADALVANKFRAAGQTCVCANRVYVDREVVGRFSELVCSRVEKLKVGDGAVGSTDVGPLIGRSAFEKVKRHVSEAIAGGAVRRVGVEPVTPGDDFGFYFPPTVLMGVRAEMAIFREETFGPVIAITEFDDEDEVIRMANSTEYGLAAYIFSEDSDRVLNFSSRLQCGHLGVNSGQGPIPEAPFGGVKKSGYGREGGMEGLLEFTDLQTVASSCVIRRRFV